MIYFKNCISGLFNTWRWGVMRVYLHSYQNGCYTVCNSRQQDQRQGRDSSRYSLSAMVQSFDILKGCKKDHILSLQVLITESRCKRAWLFIILHRLEFNSPKQTLCQTWLKLTMWFCIFPQYLVLNKKMKSKKVYRQRTKSRLSLRFRWAQRKQSHISKHFSFDIFENADVIWCGAPHYKEFFFNLSLRLLLILYCNFQGKQLSEDLSTSQQ